MNSVLYLLDVNSVFFTVLDYPMSYIEFVGTLFYLASVVLIAQRNMLTWPVGIVAVVLFAVLFYQIQLYSDTLEQLYYFGMSIYGWWFWRQQAPDAAQVKITVDFSPPRIMLAWAAVTLVLAGALAAVMSRIHELLPTLFPLPAALPFLDALTTVMSFVAMFLMARKKTESWLYWIIVDVIAIWLYFVKDVKFLSLLYVVLLVIAVRGLLLWRSQQAPA